MKGKFLITGILAAMLVGSSAFASLSRIAVFGSEPVFTSTAGTPVTVNAVNGSLWYDDDYNVFYNPAYVNDNKNYVTINKGLEGGFFKSEFENFAYGLYFNRGGTNTATNGTAANGAANGGAGVVNTATGMMAPGFATIGNYINGTTSGTVNGNSIDLNTQRPIDLFFGGDTGLKWGAHVAWAYNRNQMVGNSNSNSGGAEITARYWHADLGAEVMGFEPFVGMTFLTKYQNNTASAAATADLNEFDGGFRYKYEGWTPYFVYHKFRESGQPVSVAAGTPQMLQTRHNIWGLGVGHDTKVADGVHVLKNIGFWLDAVQDDTGTAGFSGAPATTSTVDGQTTPAAGQNYTDYVIPINVALEAEATSWLVLRAGVSYDFINDRKYNTSNSGTNPNPAAITNANQSLSGNASFRIGSTLKFGKLHIDSAFGNGTPAASGGETLNTSSIGFDSQLFALVSASYHW